MKELRTMMNIQWQIDLETCEQVERALGELVDHIFANDPATEEEKQFVRNTAKTISESLQRDCKVTLE